MILAIDAGNTNIVLGGIEGENICFTARVATDRKRTADEYAMTLQSLLDLYGADPAALEGAIIASVVSELTEVLRTAAERVTHKRPIVVGSGIKTGVNIRIDDPGQLGADLVVGAVAATAKFPKPLIIFDLGTATTMSVVDREGRFLGGAIMAGPRVGVEALSAGTSQLPHIDLEVPGKVIGANTVHAMQSGALYGHAAMMDGLIDRAEAELGYSLTVVATGGLSQAVVPLCKRQMALDPDLLLRGLGILYEKNK